MANQAVLRIGREVTAIQQGDDLSLAVAFQENDIRNVKALVLGPHSTPYEFGFFEFAVRFKDDYPSNPPKVEARTTNGGRCTWRGEHSGEEWSSAQGLESILISIQSLMSSNPYENEPGFENARSPQDQKHQAAYVDKIRHETIRIAVIQKLEEYLGIQQDGTIVQLNRAWDPEAEAELDPEDLMDDDTPAVFEPFKDLCKRRFLWYYESFLNTIEAEAKKHRDGTRFEKMPFEGQGNSMDGTFNYTELKRRLAFVKEVIGRESLKWTDEGAIAARQELGIAVNLQRQFEQVVEAYKQQSKLTVDIKLVNKNPFVWQLIYFGRPMTHLDGGMFTIRISLSPRFPEEQPRVVMETPLFHHRISKDGILCYRVRREDDMKTHLDAIIDVLENASPPYDPRTTVHPEASRLFWGSTDDKRQYNRRQRRTVETSTEM